jgi:hypothetical protein
MVNARAVLCLGMLFLNYNPMTSVAQQPANGKSAWQPSEFPALSFKDTAVAQASPDSSSVMFIFPELILESKTRDIPVQKFRTEARTRTVDVEGKTVEQTYTVNVPYTEMITQTYQIEALGVAPPSNAPTKRVNVLMKDIRAWHVEGDAIDATSLGTLLPQWAHVFAMEMPAEIDFKGVDPYYASFLRPQTIVFYLAPGSIKK